MLIVYFSVMFSTKAFKHEDGEFLVQMKTDTNYISMPYIFLKKTKMEEIDYPLITVAYVIKIIS
jgi:hypothetical protein